MTVVQPRELHAKKIKNWQWCAVLLLLSLAPLNSKLAGACWLGFSLLGAWSFKCGLARGSTLEFDAAKGWFLACLSALALRAVTQFYWGDSWGERHAEFRLLFGSLGLLGLVHYAHFTSDQLKWLSYSLVLALWAGFGWMLVFGPALAPTNQIPWGASMSLLVCVVMALTFSASSQRMPVRLFTLLAWLLVCALFCLAKLAVRTALFFGSLGLCCGITLEAASSGVHWRIVS